MNNGTLRHEGDNDYTLVSDSAWVETNNFAIHIFKGNGTLTIQLFSVNDVTIDPIDQIVVYEQ